MIKIVNIFLILLLASSCILFDNSNVSDEDLDLYCQEMYLYAKIVTKKVCESNESLKEKLSKLVSNMPDVIDEDGTLYLSQFVINWSEGIEDPDVQDALQLLWIRLQRNSLINFKDGTKVLTSKSAKIIHCVFKGVADGCS